MIAGIAHVNVAGNICRYTTGIAETGGLPYAIVTTGNAFLAGKSSYHSSRRYLADHVIIRVRYIHVTRRIQVDPLGKVKQ